MRPRSPRVYSIARAMAASACLSILANSSSSSAFAACRSAWIASISASCSATSASKRDWAAAFLLAVFDWIMARSSRSTPAVVAALAASPLGGAVRTAGTAGRALAGVRLELLRPNPAAAAPSAARRRTRTAGLVSYALLSRGDIARPGRPVPVPVPVRVAMEWPLMPYNEPAFAVLPSPAVPSGAKGTAPPLNLSPPCIIGGNATRGCAPAGGRKLAARSTSMMIGRKTDRR